MRGYALRFSTTDIASMSNMNNDHNDTVAVFVDTITLSCAQHFGSPVS